MKRTGTIAAAVLLLMIAALALGACGDDDDDDDDAGGATSTQSSGQSTATATSDDGDDGGNGDDDDDGDDGGGNGGGGDSSDLDQVASALEPPNSTETTRFSSSDGMLIGYESDESLDSLKSYYDGKIDDLGLNLLGTLSSGESYNWIIGAEDGSGVQGGVTIAPSGTGTTVVSITLSLGS